MRYAIEHGYKQMLNMDADFSHPPRYLPDLLAGMDPPTALGRRDDRFRYVPGGRIEGSGGGIS